MPHNTSTVDSSCLAMPFLTALGCYISIKEYIYIYIIFNNKDIIQMHLGFNWFIYTQKTLAINASFVNSRQRLLVMLTFFCHQQSIPLIFQVISTYIGQLTDISAVISDINCGFEIF